MSWVEIFVVLVVSHLVGDYLVQTDWQATHKHGGLGPDPAARRALLSHAATYTLSFVPALIWLAGELGAGVLPAAAAIGLPHLVQDDGRVVAWWMTHVKHADIHEEPIVAACVDQVLHVCALFALALVLGQ
jgi:hypothetical protein